MSPGVLDSSLLSHPCEAAFEVFLGPCDSGRVLYLKSSAASSAGPRSASVSGQLQSASATEAGRQAIDHTKFNLRYPNALTLPLTDGICDRILLHCDGSIQIQQQVLFLLLDEISRVLAPNGEFLFLWRGSSGLCGENAIVNDQSCGRRNSDRLRAVTRIVFLVIELRWRLAFKRLFRLRGFRDSEWLFPEYTTSGMPTRVHRFDEFARFRWVRNWKSFLRAVSMRSVMIRMSTNSMPRSLLDEVLTQTRNTAKPRPGPNQVDSLLVSPKEKVVVMAHLGAMEIVLRLPFSVHARAGCRRNLEVLQSLHATSNHQRLIPRPLVEQDCFGWYYSAESRIWGQPLRNQFRDAQELELVEDLLRSLNPVDQLVTAKLTGGLFDDLISAPLALIGPLVSSDEVRSAMAAYFAKEFHGSSFVVGISHGDLSLSNSNLEDGEVSGIIDWDEGSIHGLPVLDALSHLLSRQTQRSQGFGNSVLRLASRRWPSDIELQWLDRLYAYFRIDSARHFALVMLQWLHVTSNQSQHWFGRDGSFIEQNVNKIADVISAIARDAG